MTIRSGFAPFGVTIRGYGHYLPVATQKSEELDKIYNSEIGWTLQKFGIANRYIANENETTSFMAAEACKEAMANAGWQNGDFDLLVGACAVMEQPIPSTSVFVQEKLGLAKSGIHCFDVNQTCLSFMAALDIVALYIQSGRVKRTIIFSSEIASCGLDYQNPETSAIFGDGAAAICLEADDTQFANNGNILASKFETYSNGIETSHLRSGGTKIRIDDYEKLREGSKFFMNPSGIFRAAGRNLPRLIDEVLGDANLSIKDINVIIPHQASSAGIEYLRHILKDDKDKIIDIFPQHGNQIAASVPMALYYANKNGYIQKGSNILLLGTAAGISMGAMVIRI